MKVIGLSCSARKNGNTVNAVNVALNCLPTKGIETIPLRRSVSRQGYRCNNYWKPRRNFSCFILTSWLAPGKHFVGWIELDPRSTAGRNAQLKDSWLKGNMMEDEQNRKRVTELAKFTQKY